MINRTIVNKTTEVMVQLYKSLVRPHLEYCSSARSPHYRKDKKLIEHVQHRFSRMVPAVRADNYPVRLQKLNLWSLEERRNRAVYIKWSKDIRSCVLKTYLKWIHREEVAHSRASWSEVTATRIWEDFSSRRDSSIDGTGSVHLTETGKMYEVTYYLCAVCGPTTLKNVVMRVATICLPWMKVSDQTSKFYRVYCVKWAINMWSLLQHFAVTRSFYSHFKCVIIYSSCQHNDWPYMVYVSRNK
jgi:hypothetical protein